MKGALFLFQVTVPYTAVDAVVQLLESWHLEAISWSECDDAPASHEKDALGFPIASLFRIEGYTHQQLNKHDIEASLSLLAGICGAQHNFSYTFTRVTSQDWLRTCYQELPPLIVGPFCVQGSHCTHPSQAKFTLTIDAATAFGSGEHATTKGCLSTLARLSKNFVPNHIIDMGCGSGILAIGAQKLWPQATIVAADMDPESVRISKQNALKNKCPHILVTESCGFANRAVNCHNTYDLVIANILARPLIQMAPDVDHVLTPHGRIILSGLLVTQKRAVLTAYRAQGLYLEKAITINGWSTLSLRRQINVC